MMTIDPTVGGNPSRAKRGGAKGRLQSWFCGHEVYTSEWAAHDCQKKREEMSERPCALAACGAVFSPGRAGQRFHQRSCARKAMIRWRVRKANVAQGARKGLTTEQIQALEVAPIAERAATILRQAGTHTPLMGAALYSLTMALMEKAA